MLHYLHMGCQSEYDAELHLDFDCGFLIGRRIVRQEDIEAPRAEIEVPDDLDGEP